MGLTYADLQLPNFLNTHVIGVVGGVPLTFTDAIDAEQLVGGNVYVVGKKGVGKTQLLFDVYCTRFGQHGIIVEGRADLKAAELYQRINLQRLREGASSDEIIELAKAVHYRFFGADELNRCPEVTQNELLSIMNGYILHNGAPVYLGDGFSVGLATGNPGNGEYVGTFKLDGALADRLHLYINLDYWKPTDEDMAVIDCRNKQDPRVKHAEPRDISDKLVQTSQEIMGKETPIEVVIIGRYLERALDYCATFSSAENSKDNLQEKWPNDCYQKNCTLKDTLCSRVKSVGQRTVEAAERFAKGLQYIAKLKNDNATDDPVNAILVAIRLILPYSGVISQAYLREEGNFGNVNIAARNIAAEIGKEIRAEFYSADGKKPGPLSVSLAYALKGRLSERQYEATKQQWKFVLPLLNKKNEESISRLR